MYEHITYLPENYEQTEKDYPLLVFLHDREQQGSEFDKIRNIGLPKLLENKSLKLDKIVIAPQAPENETWKASKIMNLLAKVNIQYRIDSDKIFFIGIGIGGYGALKFATIYNDIPTAIVSIAGGGNANMVFYLKNIPVWLIHGTEDEIIQFYKTKALADALEKENQNFRFTELKNAGHEITDTIFDDNKIIDWLKAF